MWTDNLKVGDTVYIQEGNMGRNYLKETVAEVTDLHIIRSNGKKYLKETGNSCPYTIDDRLVEPSSQLIEAHLRQMLTTTIVSNSNLPTLSKLPLPDLSRIAQLITGKN